MDQAIAVGARAVWLQLNVIDEAAGLEVVMDAYPKIEAAALGL